MNDGDVMSFNLVVWQQDRHPLNSNFPRQPG